MPDRHRGTVSCEEELSAPPTGGSGHPKIRKWSTIRKGKPKPKGSAHIASKDVVSILTTGLASCRGSA